MGVFAAQDDDLIYAADSRADSCFPIAGKWFLHRPIMHLEGCVRMLGLTHQEVSETLVVIVVECREHSNLFCCHSCLHAQGSNTPIVSASSREIFSLYRTAITRAVYETQQPI